MEGGAGQHHTPKRSLRFKQQVRADEPPHAVPKEEDGFTGVPIIDVASQALKGRKIVVELLQVNPDARRRAVNHVVGAHRQR